MIKKIKYNHFSKIFPFIDIVIILSVFEFLHYHKFDYFIPKETYFSLLVLFFSFWIFFSIYYKKFTEIIHRSFWLAWRLIFWSSILSFFFITLTLSITNLWSVSRLFVINCTLGIASIETVLLGLFKLIQSGKNRNGTIIDRDKQLPKGVFYLKWLIPCAILLIVIYFVIVLEKTGSYIYKPWNEQGLLVLLSSWGLSTVLTRKYTAPSHQNSFYEIAPYVKSGLLMLLFIGLSYFFFRLDNIPRIFIFGTGIIFCLIEVSAFYLYFFGRVPSASDFKTPPNKTSFDTLGQKPLMFENEIQSGEISSVEKKLSFLLDRINLSYKKELNKFFSMHVPFGKINFDKIRIINTISLTNIQILKDQSIHLLINLHQLNDIRRLNVYFLECYSKIPSGGILIGCFEPLEKMSSRLRLKMPKFLFTILYPFYFVFYRVFPKIPGLKQLYFILTKGQKRVLSKAEIYGRLSFCGYQLIEEKLFGTKTYFICEKIKTVSSERKPSYGPIVQLKRIGLNRDIITIYKFRTMYPYSEFIQKDIYDKYQLEHTGKLKNDYRMTAWGRIFRRYFFDEIPQIYNWLRGDLKLVGVRALSEHYFKLYPKDLRELRVRSKPGLIPPYYVDMPHTFNEILVSEKKYLDLHSKRPISTNISYLFRAGINIIFKGARSQ